MNVQTERIDNHKAQFTVEIEAKQLDDAKRKAAKRISRSIRIKGFRKGKAPYRVIAQYVGEAAILEEAIELLGNDIYKDALEESGVEPYGPGMLDDFQVEPAPTFVFSVPLQPEVDLKEYADTRLDFEEPEVEDEDVENALKSMQRQQAEVVDDEVEEVASGHRITIDLHSEFADGEEAEDESDDDEDEDDASDTDEDDVTENTSEDAQEDNEDTPYIPKKGDQFLHRHDATLVLEPSDEPILPGFIEAMVGAKLDEDVEFELTVPEDDDDYESIGGRKVKFNITINKIEEIATPELNDDFARQIGEADGDDEVADLDSLRQRTRDELEQEARENAKAQYGEKVLAKVVEGAEIAFPELMVEEQIDDMLRDLDGNLQQQGLNLDTYMRITGTTKEMLQEQYREQAIDSLKRTLVLRELISAQEIEIGDEEIEKRIDEMMIQFGSQGDQFRQIFDTPQMRQNMMNDLLIDNIMTSLVAIGQGKDPEEAIAERAAEREADNQKARERVERMMAKQEAELAEAEDESEDAEDQAEEVVSEDESVADETDVTSDDDDAEAEEETEAEANDEDDSTSDEEKKSED